MHHLHRSFFFSFFPLQPTACRERVARGITRLVVRAAWGAAMVIEAEAIVSEVVFLVFWKDDGRFSLLPR